jgi:murein DD-endopeptidase MepM/ murein hydrolase activator NlpD
MIQIKPFHALAGAVVLLAAACATTQAVQQPDAPVAEPPDPVSPPASTIGRFPASMSVCPGMTVANRPATNADLVILNYAPLVVAEGKVTLATAPVEAGCFSSGFGPRSFSIHKGIDYYSPAAVDIYAAGAGVVKEKTYRDDFGNMLVIDHGHGVFTRYAHLQEFETGLAEGAQVKAGDTIGVMGNTASYSIPRHLHYEVLTGEWGAQAGSFALTPVDVMALPAANSGS